MASRPGRNVSVVFCDDIRGELGNKLSLMGLYQGSMFVPEFPFLLPKFCAYISVVTAYSESFKSIKIRLLKDEAIFLEHDVPNEVFRHEPIVPTPNVAATPENQVAVFSMPLVLTPFPIEQACLLRIRVIADGDELRAPGLLVRKAGT